MDSSLTLKRKNREEEMEATQGKGGHDFIVNRSHDSSDIVNCFTELLPQEVGCDIRLLFS